MECATRGAWLGVGIAEVLPKSSGTYQGNELLRMLEKSALSGCSLCASIVEFVLLQRCFLDMCALCYTPG